MGSRGIALIGTLLMAEMEELSVQFRKFLWKWRGSNIEQEKMMWEQWPWCWTWPRPSNESASLWSGSGRRTSASQGRYCGCCVATSSIRGECSSKDVVAEPLRTITAVLPGSKWSCLLLCVVLQDALSEVAQICPPLKLRVFVDDITALLMEKAKRRSWRKRPQTVSQ